jgi:hypothetical protein
MERIFSMLDRFTVGFVGFGEVNSPIEVLQRKCDEALKEIRKLNFDIVEAPIVIDDADCNYADRAIESLSKHKFDTLIICVAGWIPTHTIIRVADNFRQVPMILWGLCGYIENGVIISTADQAGTTAARFAMEAMHYKFRYVYNSIGCPFPMDKIRSFIRAAYAFKKLRTSVIGTMGYRDMLLYGTMADGVTLKSKFGIEMEPFESLEISIEAEKVSPDEIKKGVEFVRKNWKFTKECSDKELEPSVSYAIAISNRIKKRHYSAISLIDVDGMKKIIGLPPALIFMLLDAFCDVCTIPENDIMGSVTQLIVKFSTGQIAPYGEFYEFFEKSFIIGVPDFIPKEATKGDSILAPSAFGLLATSFPSVSQFKDGPVTLARLINIDGVYKMHMFCGESKQPPAWEECGWEPPAPRLPSLEVFPSCSMDEFSQKVSSQHIILAYGDESDVLRQLCYLLNIEVI